MAPNNNKVSTQCDLYNQLGHSAFSKDNQNTYLMEDHHIFDSTATGAEGSSNVESVSKLVDGVSSDDLNISNSIVISPMTSQTNELYVPVTQQNIQLETRDYTFDEITELLEEEFYNNHIPDSHIDVSNNLQLETRSQTIPCLQNYTFDEISDLPVEQFYIKHIPNNHIDVFNNLQTDFRAETLVPKNCSFDYITKLAEEQFDNENYRNCNNEKLKQNPHTETLKENHTPADVLEKTTNNSHIINDDQLWESENAVATSKKNSDISTTFERNTPNKSGSRCTKRASPIFKVPIGRAKRRSRKQKKEHKLSKLLIEKCTKQQQQSIFRNYNAEKNKSAEQRISRIESEDANVNKSNMNRTKDNSVPAESIHDDCGKNSNQRMNKSCVEATAIPPASRDLHYQSLQQRPTKKLYTRDSWLNSEEITKLFVDCRPSQPLFGNIL